jgi:CBS-domain-containing membrane protein
MSTIKKIMSKSIVTVSLTTSLKMINEKFYETGLSHLIVTDTVGTYKGIISKTDMLARVNKLMLSSSGKKFTELELSTITASDIMTRNTVNLEVDHSIEYATEALLQKKFHALPVVKNYKAVGILTKHDLLQHLYESMAFVKNANHE